MSECSKVKDLLPLSARGDLETADLQNVRRHLSACPACRAEEELYLKVILQTRSLFSAQNRLGQLARGAIALAASERVSRRRWLPEIPLFLQAVNPRAGLASAASALLVMALVALPVVLQRRAVPHPEERVTAIQILADSGLVKLAWSDGEKESYTVYKGTDPRTISHGEAHVVNGTVWTDPDPWSAPVVFYRVE